MINNLPEKLQQLRNSYGYSQKQVADKLGVSSSIVSDYETGERTPSLENLLALSYLYNTSTDYLLGKTKTSPQFIFDTNGLTENQIAAIVNLINSIKENN